MVAMNGSPKSMNGCFASADRYLEAIVLASAVPRNLRLGKTAMMDEGLQMPNLWCLRYRILK